MIDLFSVALTSGVSWGMTRLLDALVDCRRCRSRQRVDVDNREYNHFVCGRCRHALPEYVNASENTVQPNGAVVAAQIYGIHWPSWRDTFKLYYSLDVVNSRYQDVVVELILSEFRGSVFHTYQFKKRPTHEYTFWENTWLTIPASRFPHHRSMVAVDLVAYNIWGDILDEHRTLMDRR